MKHILTIFEIPVNKSNKYFLPLKCKLLILTIMLGIPVNKGNENYISLNCALM